MRNEEGSVSKFSFTRLRKNSVINLKFKSWAVSIIEFNWVKISLDVYLN